MNINPVLALLALVAGYAFSWYLVVVKSATRTVPVRRDAAALAGPPRDADVAARVGAVAGGLAGGATAVGRAVAEGAGDWLARLDTAKDRLLGAADHLRDEATEALGRVRSEVEDHFDRFDGTHRPDEPAEPADAGLEYPVVAEPLEERPLVEDDPAEQDEPADLADPADLAEPMEPIEPIEPADAVAPVKPAAAAGWGPALDPDPIARAGAAGAAVTHLAAWADAPEDGSVPDGYTVKGDKKARLYLVDSDADYDRARPDIWFVDEDAAVEAGYAHYIRRPKNPAADEAGDEADDASASVSEPVQDALVDHPDDHRG